MTVLREPFTSEERQISTRAAHLKALLDAAREAGMSGHPEYGWHEQRPAEPRLVIAGVPVHAIGIDNANYVIADRRISVTRIDIALRAIRALAATRADTSAEPVES